jgi:hypothetical protein
MMKMDTALSVVLQRPTGGYCEPRALVIGAGAAGGLAAMLLAEHLESNVAEHRPHRTNHLLSFSLCGYRRSRQSSRLS